MMKIRLLEIELENKLEDFDDKKQEIEQELASLKKEEKKLKTELAKQTNNASFAKKESEGLKARVRELEIALNGGQEEAGDGSEKDSNASSDN